MKKFLSLIIAVCICFSSLAKSGVPIWDKPIYKTIKLWSPSISEIALVITPKEYQNTTYDRLNINVWTNEYTDERWWKVVVWVHCTYTVTTGFPPVKTRVSGTKTWEGEVSPYNYFGNTEWTLTSGEEFPLETWPCDYCVDHSQFGVTSWGPE